MDSQSKRKALRWQIIPSVLCAVFGAITLLGNGFVAGAMVYFNVNHGPIVEHPSTPSLNKLAPTATHITGLTLGLMGGAAGVVGSWAWMRRPWWAALSISFACVCGMLLANMLALRA